MGSLFRSEEMSLCQVFLQKETAYSYISHLGELGLVQFKDVNANQIAFNRLFINEARRCEEMERIIRHCRREIQKEGIQEFEPEGSPTAPEMKELGDLEMMFQNKERELDEVIANNIALKETYLELIEFKQILIKIKVFFQHREDSVLSHHNLIERNPINSCEAEIEPGQLEFICGVILMERLLSFERMLWRSSYGNIYLKQTELAEVIQDPKTGDRVHKVVFIMFCPSELLKIRAIRICEGYRVSLYPCPTTLKEQETLLSKLNTEIEETRLILYQSFDQRHQLLLNLAQDVKTWHIKIAKAKAIYHTMNMFNHDVAKECLIAECWCTTKNINWVKQILKLATEESRSSVPSILNTMRTRQVPPTYNIVNKFTNGFQNIVDAYGIANYGEVNPAPFMMITFPFLFAIMFGDGGHGCLMTIFAAWMVITERKLMKIETKNELWDIIFTGRYIILLMGAFSIYTGLLYNDIFSKPINIFGSHWTVQFNVETITNMKKAIILDPGISHVDYPYPFGIDPIWKVANNKILFLNSYKMKISIIFGVSQLLFGVILSLFNHVHFKNYANIICEFLPQMLWLTLVFGYLVVLIFYKWVNFTAKDASCAPSLLMIFINMFLYKYPDEPCYIASIYELQQPVQTAFLLIAVICIPWMAFLKPIVQLFSRRKIEKDILVDEDIAEVEEDSGFGDAIILQTVRMIEFCLGTVSHTASYLRLWALSLAHAELSEVLWTMVLAPCLRRTDCVGVIMLYVGFAFWAFLTVSILVVMEGLSAFLHAVRLHWVEYQSKFYEGQGYAFCPFHFKTILEKEDSDKLI